MSNSKPFLAAAAVAVLHVLLLSFLLFLQNKNAHCTISYCRGMHQEMTNKDMLLSLLTDVTTPNNQKCVRALLHKFTRLAT